MPSDSPELQTTGPVTSQNSTADLSKTSIEAATLNGKPPRLSESVPTSASRSPNHWLNKIFSLDYFDKIWVPILTGLGAVLLTTWFNEQASQRQRETSQNLNHQAIFESYITKVNDMYLNEAVIADPLVAEAKNADFSIAERNLIYGITLPILRDLTQDQDRKARLILFLYRMKLIDTGVKNFGEPALINPLNRADLKDANFKGYNLVGINFTGADLRGANFIGAHLDQAFLAYADLSPSEPTTEPGWLTTTLRTLFRRQSLRSLPADLTDARLVKANLSQAILTNADLTRTDLSQADLSRADLTKANLTGANLAEANLTEVNLTGATVTEAQLRDATLCQTVLASGETSDRDCAEAP